MPKLNSPLALATRYVRKLAEAQPLTFESGVQVVNIEQSQVTSDCADLLLDLSDGTTIRLAVTRYTR